jgi:uncharacterized protein YijF (DUF1287 family)
LSTYQQQVKVGDDVVERAILVYLDGVTYVVVNEYEASEGLPAIAAGTRVRFALDLEDKINEEATLEIVPGYGTRYATDATFKAQAELFAADVKGAKSPFLVNLLADGKTDSIDDFDLVVTEFQQLLVKAFLQAAGGKGATLRLNNVPVAPAIGSNVRLANGRYYASINADEKGQQFFGLFIVEGNVVVNAFIDATRLVAGKVTTFVALGNSETPLRAGVTVEPTNDDFFEKIGGDVTILVQSGFANVGGTSLAGIASAFGYTSRDDIGVVPNGSGVYSLLKAYQNPIRLLHHELADQALRAYPAEYAKAVLADWKALNTDKTVARPLFSQAGTVNLVGNVIDYSDVADSGVEPFPGQSTAKFSIRLDSLDRTIANLNTTDSTIVAERGLTANGTARFTMQLDFDGVTYEETLSVQVKSIVAWNRDVLAAAVKAAPASTDQPLFQGSNGFVNGSLVNLNNMVTISGVGYGKPLPSSLGLINSGLAPATQTEVASSNVTYWLNYGLVNATQITTLDLTGLAPGKQTITARIIYASGIAADSTPAFITETFAVEVLTPAQALERGQANALPGNIIPNGEVNASSVTLPLVHPTVSGLTYVWEVLSGGDNAKLVAPAAGATSQSLAITRLYSQDRVRLQLTIVGNGILTGNISVFEFRVLPAPKADIVTRIAADIKDSFARVPKFWDITRGDNLLLGQQVDTLNSYLSLSDLTIDNSIANSVTTIVYTISDSNSPKLQNSAAHLATNNLVYVDPNSNVLRLGQNASRFMGDVSVTVTATVQVRFQGTLATDAPDVAVSESFTINLIRDVKPGVGAATVLLFESGVSEYAVVKLLNSGLNGALNATAQIAVLSGTTVVVSPVAVTIQNAINAATSALATDQVVDTGFAAGSATLRTRYELSDALSAEIRLAYKYYVDGVLVDAPVEKIPFTTTAFAVPTSIVEDDFIGTNASDDDKVFALTLTNGIWRPGVGVGDIVLDLAPGSGLFNNFSIVGRPADNILVIRSSGSAAVELTAPNSGVLTINPEAFYATSGTVAAPVAVTVAVQGFAADVPTSSGVGTAIALGANYVSLTLNTGVFRSASLINSGMFVFPGSIAADNKTAILSGVVAGNMEVTPDGKTLLIRASSGLLAQTVVASGAIQVTSGAYIPGSETATSIATAAFSERVATVSGLVAESASNGHTKVVLTLTSGVFRTVAQGFDIAGVVFTGSGVAGSTTLLENQSVASVFNAALQQGKFTISGGALTIILDSALLNNASGIIASISDKAILRYSTTAGATPVVITRTN